MAWRHLRYNTLGRPRLRTTPWCPGPGQPQQLRSVMGDSKEKRLLAVKQREECVLNPGAADYDQQLSKLWGGPPVRWFDEAMRTFPSKFPAATPGQPDSLIALMKAG